MGQLWIRRGCIHPVSLFVVVGVRCATSKLLKSPCTVHLLQVTWRSSMGRHPVPLPRLTHRQASAAVVVPSPVCPLQCWPTTRPPCPSVRRACGCCCCYTCARQYVRWKHSDVPRCLVDHAFAQGCWRKGFPPQTSPRCRLPPLTSRAVVAGVWRCYRWVQVQHLAAGPGPVMGHHHPWELWQRVAMRSISASAWTRHPQRSFEGAATTRICTAARR